MEKRVNLVEDNSADFETSVKYVSNRVDEIDKTMSIYIKCSFSIEAKRILRHVGNACKCDHRNRRSKRVERHSARFKVLVNEE